VTDAERAQQLAEEPLNDIGNGRRLIAWFGADLRYSPVKGWLVWDGRRWEPNSVTPVQWAKETARRLLLEAFAVDADKRPVWLKWARESGNISRVAGMLKSASTEPEIAIRDQDLDADMWRCCCETGEIDLRDGSVHPHRRESLITRISPVAYDPAARCERWERFLSQSTDGDTELQSFLQRIAGYSLTGSIREEVLFFIHGPTAAGKSTFVDAIRGAIGDYGHTADFESFLARTNTGAPRNDIAGMVGVRMVSSVEVDEGKRLAEGLLKTLTGGDPVRARLLYQDFFEFVPQFKLWLVANDAPRVRDTDGAMWRRILRIPFDKTVPLDERDHTLKPYLKDPDGGGPAVLAWAVRGCLEWQQTGLAIPATIAKATAAYRSGQDPMTPFFAECCTFGDGLMVTSASLREAYLGWHRDAGGGKELSPKAVGVRLEARGCSPGMIGRGNDRKRVWYGVGLKTDDEVGTLIDAVLGTNGNGCEQIPEKNLLISHEGEFTENAHKRSHPFPLANGDLRKALADRVEGLGWPARPVLKGGIPMHSPDDWRAWIGQATDLQLKAAFATLEADL
jgi:putative DNA primase/helicase